MIAEAAVAKRKQREPAGRKETRVEIRHVPTQLALSDFIRLVTAISPLLERPLCEWGQGEMVLLKEIDCIGNEQIDFGSLQASLP
jgi:hypothetical protein